MLRGALDLVAVRGATELLAGHAWDLGDLSISRSRKAPILFARRLHIASTVEQLRAVLQHRAGRPGGMILTTTASPLSVAEWPAAHQVVPLVKLLSPVGQTFGLDVRLLKNIYAGHSLDASSIGPVYLAPDGRVLRIRDSEYLSKARCRSGSSASWSKALRTTNGCARKRFSRTLARRPTPWQRPSAAIQTGRD